MSQGNPCLERFSWTLQDEWLAMSEVSLDEFEEANKNLTCSQPATHCKFLKNVLESCRMLSRFVLGLVLGYFLWIFLSHPKSLVPKHCPKIKLGRRVQILPQLKIFYKGQKAIICHHWLCAVLILIFFFIFSDGLIFFKGFLAGTVGQGLGYKDRFHLREVH